MPQKTKKGKPKVKVGKRYVGEGEPVFFIAEIGNNHNGDFFLAKRTIEEAVKAGADAVKFQKRFIPETFARELRERPQTKDQIFGATYGEYRENLELDLDEFIKLKEFAESLGVVFFATPFDKMSVDFLEEVGVEVYKVASFDATNLPLLEYVAKKGKPMFLSTGTSSLEELDEALSVVLPYNDQLIVKHCVSVYPTPDEKLNLATILFLKERYSPIPIGYSGHEKGILPSLAAVAMGARSIERHITLDKSLPGPDHATVSIDPAEFKEMVEGARRIERGFGVYGKFLFDEEMAPRNKHTKSIVSACAIPKGAILTAEMLVCKSPGYGLKPRQLSSLFGKRAARNIEEDTVLT
ncbi:hypothetical protein A3A35_01245, partial [Candidatus Kaiserbacteria bacterium RIFCSPLOWO2_01_FULL_51_21]